MIGYYRLVGFVAIVALLLNLLIMGAIMSLLEFTLTLPGFAGAILTVGMAVDANVIIFEKIKEDLRAGKSASVAIESGFNASFWTILDANVTTLIAAVILYLPKDGPIMGFAIVLFFGLVSSMFTSLFISKLLLDWSQYLFRFKKLSIGWGFK
jgi:preprotein translocase subunit SecD